ncbi:MULTISPECIES: GumC family protein [Falsihalocynthiibacter]
MKSGSASAFDLREIWNLLRRKIRLIGLSMALVLGAALIYLFYVTPLYSATAWLFVDTDQKNLLAPNESYASPGSRDNARIESEVLILKSNTVALATIERSQLVDHPLYKFQLGLTERAKTLLGIAANKPPTGPDLVNRVLEKFDRSTTIRRMGQTYLISVTATSQDRHHAAELANSLSQTYINLQVQSKVNATLAARDILQGQIASARDVLAQTEGAFDRYIDANLFRLTQESGNASLHSLRAQLQETNAFHLEAEVRVTQAQAAFEVRDWNTLAQTLGDEALKDLTQQRADLSQKLGQTDASTPDAIELRGRLTALEKNLETRTSMAVSDLRLDATQLEMVQRDQRRTLRTTVLSGDLSPTTLAQIYQLQQEADIAQRHYTTLLSRAAELQAQALVHVADTRIVSAALAPSRASFPNKNLILVLAVIIALVLGVGLAFLSEYYVGGISSTTQLANVLPVPVATAVPRMDLAPDQSSIADYVLDAPLSVYAESLRLLRSAIDQSLRAQTAPQTPPTCTVIMVTSSIPAEGKSTVALGLARTYAAAGKSTLLIDADLRKPSQHIYLDLKPDTSLQEFLSGDRTVADGSEFYTSDPKSNLGVILGRDRADVPTDQLLQSDTFKNLLETAKMAMDIIILDTSPLLPVVDARYIAPHADVVVDCVRFGVTEQRDLRAAFGQLTASLRPDTPVVTLLNHDESKHTGYRYDGYYGKE